MIKLQRQERKGDRNRRHVRTPTEALVPTFRDGMVFVTTARFATARHLERQGFTRMRDEPQAPAAPPATTIVDIEAAPPDVKPAADVGNAKVDPDAIGPDRGTAARHPAPPRRPSALWADLTTRQLRALAKVRKIKGRSSMDRAQLLDALLA